MQTSEISVATMTWGRDAEERTGLEESLQALAALDIATYLTDGGSGQEFVASLRRVPHFQVFEAQHPGVWPQMRRSLQAAQGSPARFILYTEPDKKDFFRTSLHSFINTAPNEEDVGIVLAARSAGSFATFPAFQQYTETAINRCCGEFTGQENDYTYGPFLFHRKLLPYLKYVSDEIGWGWRPYLFALAHRLGYRVEFIVGDWPCPPEQREDNPAERILRMRQLSQSIQGLLLASAVSVE